MTDRTGGSDDMVNRAYESVTDEQASAEEPRPTIAPFDTPPLPPAEHNIVERTADEIAADGYLAQSRWHFGHFVLVVLAGLIGSSLAVGFGADINKATDVFGIIFPAQVGGSLLTAWYLSVARGNKSWRVDFGLTLRARDSWGLLGGVGLQILGLIATGVLLLIVGDDAEPSQNVAELAEQSTGSIVVLVFIGTVLLAPLVEEVIYRGMLLSYLRRVFGDRSSPRVAKHLAVGASAAIFAGVHLVDPGTLLLMPGLFIVGLGLGYAALRSGSLSLPLFLHAGVNLTGFLLTQFADDLQDLQERLEESVEAVMMFF